MTATKDATHLVADQAQALLDKTLAKIGITSTDLEALLPKKLYFLNGAPGAGKGTHGDFLRAARGVVAPMIVTSSLLNTPEAKAIKETAGLCGDDLVAEVLIRELIKPSYAQGAMVDGFPRTPAQAALTAKLLSCVLSRHAPSAEKSHMNGAGVIELYAEEALSVHRQTKRGREASLSASLGHAVEVRKTDLDAQAARERHRLYTQCSSTFMDTLSRAVPTVVIPMGGSESVERARILQVIPPHNPEALQGWEISI